MKRDDAGLRQARGYLRDNEALRETIGALDDDVLEPGYLGVGEHNLNYRFNVASRNRDFVLRVNVASQPFHDNQVAYEFGALKALASSGRVPEAVYLDDSPAAPGEGALVIGFCEGDELDFDCLRPGDLRCAAQIMADVHAVPVPPDCTVHRPKDPLKALFRECVERFEVYRSSAFEDARITRWAEKFLAAAEPMTRTACTENDCTHIVNTETLPSHFLIPASSAEAAADAASENATPEQASGQAQVSAARSNSGRGRLCGCPGYFIDWERPVIGEVAQDVAYFVSPTTTFWDSEFLFPADEVSAFVEDYWRAVDGRFDRGGFDGRFRAYLMMTALRSTTWCCRALINYGRILDVEDDGDCGDGGESAAPAHTTDKTARKLPVYLSDEFMHRIALDCFGLK